MNKNNTITSGYLNAQEFFESIKPLALTYDDVSLATQYSEVLPKETNIQTSISECIKLQTPIISADMDTVTESEMAIAMALNGGMGIIHYNMNEKDQVREVARVKNHIHGLIQEPITVSPNQYIGEVIELINQKGYKFDTFPVVDEKHKLIGMLSGRVVIDRYRSKLVSEAMRDRSILDSINQSELGSDPILIADKYFNEHMGAHKLHVVDSEDRLCGLFTIRDIERITKESFESIQSTRDSSYRLRCAVALGLTRSADGQLDENRILEHLSHLLTEGVDAVAISSAHAHTASIAEAIKLIRSEHKDLTIIAGNVTSAQGVEFLADAGANCIKIGQGPGSICTTRIVAGVGIPQLSALYDASIGAQKNGVKILADGGINKSGDIVKALTLADAVICGGMLAGCKEAPGNVIEVEGKIYKEYRGMGSLKAMKAGSASRYGHASKDMHRKVSAEGIEGLKEISGSVESVLSQLIGGIQSGLGYLGANSLKELKERARYVQTSAAAQRESKPHDIIEVKAIDRSGS